MVRDVVVREISDLLAPSSSYCLAGQSEQLIKKSHSIVKKAEVSRKTSWWSGGHAIVCLGAGRLQSETIITSQPHSLTASHQQSVMGTACQAGPQHLSGADLQYTR